MSNENDFCEIVIKKDTIYRNKVYSCIPSDYVFELNLNGVHHGNHIGKTPEIVERKVRRLLSNLRIDMSRYKFVVKE